MPKLLDHPLAELFPLMTDAELAELAADIGANGLRDNIWLCEGKILDGRNRYRACLIAKVEPRTQVYRGDDELAFVVSKNLHRRHLSASQRSMIAAELTNGHHGGDRKSDQAAKLPLDIPHEKAGKLLGISERTVRDAVTVKEEGVPELAEAVKAGDVPVSTAAKVAKLPKAKQRAAVKAGPKAVKEAAKKAEPKVVPPAATDAWGIPIQPHAEEAFAAVPKFRELLSAIRLAKKLFNECANLPGGKFLTLPEVSSYRRGKKGDDGEDADRFVHEGLETAERQVKANVPTHTVCPLNYIEGKHPKDCPTCRGLNWTPVLSGNTPKAAEAKAKEAFGV